MLDHYGSIAFQTHSGRRYMAGIMPIRRKLHPINQSFKRMVTYEVRLMLGSCTFYLSVLCVLIDQSSLAQPNPPSIRFAYPSKIAILDHNNAILMRMPV